MIGRLLWRRAFGGDDQEGAVRLPGEIGPDLFDPSDYGLGA
jgi:hypothetical protein